MIEVFNLVGQYENAMSFLDGYEFSYREGTSKVRDIIINTQVLLGIQYLEEANYEEALKRFLESLVQEEEAGSETYGKREKQVHYYIGLAYEALGKQSLANDHFRLVTEMEAGGEMTIMSYYKGLSYIKLGDKGMAKKVFDTMIDDANKQLRGPEVTAIKHDFGGREAENTRMSHSYTVRGLGYKGLGKSKKANKDLEKASGLNHSNVWAKKHLYHD
ncbi:MAG TPA: tetratricopeptide repeat protein [Mariniphaga anaerophila]|uniref:Tetratricopeptide repeat protein n=1 Tax=Mariniphaga anaerophila TaxID=1484053 RepID=A0A831LTF0_9BACT|nr:tetratricopeptide repeat protein [Mariniphaga anaerophila]